MQRSTLRYQGHRDRQEALRMRLRELAANRVRFGYRRLTVLLKREGWRVNAKRIYRNRANQISQEGGEPNPRAASDRDGSQSALEHGLCERPVCG